MRMRNAILSDIKTATTDTDLLRLQLELLLDLRDEVSATHTLLQRMSLYQEQHPARGSKSA